MKKLRHNDLQDERKPKQREGRVLVGIVVLTTALVLFGRCPGEVEPIQKECPPCPTIVETKKPEKKPVKPEKKPEKPDKEVAIVMVKPPEKRTLGPCPSKVASGQQESVARAVRSCAGEIRNAMGNYDNPLLVKLNSIVDTSGKVEPSKNPGVAVPLCGGIPCEDEDNKNLGDTEIMRCLNKNVSVVRTKEKIEEPGCTQTFRVIIPKER